MKAFSLRARLLTAFGLFGLALCTTFGWLLPRLVLWTEDRIFERQLRAQWELARNDALAGAQPIEQPAPGMSFGLEGRGLGPELAEFVAELRPGFHEFNDQPRPGWPSTELLFLIEDLPDGRRLHGLYDVAPYEGMEGLWDRLYLSTMGAGLALALVALGLGVGLVRQLSRALLELEQLAQRETLAQDSLVVGRQDELGRIARAWTSAFTQAEDALQRQRRFSRDASHELRTPITAAAGALENLASLDQADQAQREVWLERARSALTEMEELVGVFLWLARGREHDLHLEPLALAPELQRLLGELPATGPEVRLELRGDPVVRVPAVVLRIVLGNLLRNAHAHAGAGPVEVRLEDNAVLFENPQAEPDPGGHRTMGFGFGLEIVRDLCRRFDWHLDLGPRPGQRFGARLEFKDREARAEERQP
jgi:His Kinase A (phospho-acceptor) domain